ncbi:MAG TPA: hypothetical protein PLD54_03730, partial [Candidatus Levybacteria bacterium]|nr:hypothetical protein [Candidatus Levybacteria bacterium]
SWNPSLPSNIREAKAKGKAIYSALLAIPEDAVTYGRTARMNIDEQTELVEIAKSAAEIIDPNPIENLELSAITLQNYVTSPEVELLPNEVVIIAGND